MLNVIRRQILSPLFVLYLSLVFLFVMTPLRPEIASSRNLANLMVMVLPLLALAVGQTFVMATGGIDLSMTGLVALASVIGGGIMTAGGSDQATTGQTWLGILCILGIGSGAGLFHGLLVACLKMPAFLVTLVALMLYQGLAKLLQRNHQVGALPDDFITGMEGGGGVPIGLVMLLGLVILAHLLLTATRHGRALLAVGQNAATARVSGIPVRRTLIWSYGLSGFCTGLATLLYMARLETGKAGLVSDSVLLDCIAAVVIGGTSLSGGRATIIGTLLGTLFIMLVSTSLNLFGMLQIWHVLIIKGFVILAAAGLESWRTSLRRHVLSDAGGPSS